MVLVAVDKLNRKVLGYLCRNGSILTYCCVECDVEFEAANQLEKHMSKHELRPQQSEEDEEKQQIQVQPNGDEPNDDDGMEADTTNGTSSEIDIQLTREEIENRLRSEYDLKQCSIPLFRFNYDIGDLKSESDDTSFESLSAGKDDDKSNESIKTLRKRTKAPSPRNTAGSPKKLFECEQCPMTFAHAGHLRRHCNSAHPVVKTFVCCLDGIQFVSNEELIEHQQQTHQPDSAQAVFIPCPRCGVSVKNLKLHLRDHELETAYELAMSTGDDMAAELIDDTQTEATDDGIKMENRESFDADSLQTIGLEVEYIVTSDSEFNMSTFSNILNGVDSMDTDTCIDVKPPIALDKSKIKRKSVGGKFWLCTQCPKKFRLQMLLEQHERNHERPRIPCVVCNKQITKKSLRAHLLKFHRPNIAIIKEQKAEQENHTVYIVE